jgi:hypothetical protein
VGNWRPPLTEAEKAEKSTSRQQAVRRKIQRLCKLLEGGAAIPEGQQADTPTLVEWIGYCRRAGLHAQGELLFRRGGLSLDELSEADQVSVQEDYDVCVRALERAGVAKATKSSSQQHMNI